MRLNCDLGEGFGQWKNNADQLAMPHIDMANIACGFHASDPSIMANTIRLAKQHKVQVGAHPGYPDLQGFGRRSLKMNRDDLINCIVYQVGALSALAKAQGVEVEYVKPHGALYNDMMADNDILESVLIACRSVSLPLMLLAQADNLAQQQLAKQFDVPLIFEGFCDRRYNAAGQLCARSEPGSVLTSESEILEQVKQFKLRALVTDSGDVISVEVDTLCVHGDNPQAVALIQQIRAVINE